MKKTSLLLVLIVFMTATICSVPVFAADSVLLSYDFENASQATDGFLTMTKFDKGNIYEDNKIVDFKTSSSSAKALQISAEFGGLGWEEFGVILNNKDGKLSKMTSFEADVYFPQDYGLGAYQNAFFVACMAYTDTNDKFVSTGSFLDIGTLDKKVFDAYPDQNSKWQLASENKVTVGSSTYLKFHVVYPVPSDFSMNGAKKVHIRFAANTIVSDGPVYIDNLVIKGSAPAATPTPTTSTETSAPETTAGTTEANTTDGQTTESQTTGSASSDATTASGESASATTSDTSAAGATPDTSAADTTSDTSASDTSATETTPEATSTESGTEGHVEYISADSGEASGSGLSTGLIIALSAVGLGVVAAALYFLVIRKKK